MMTLRYSQQDARLWAAFSGDYNPVHFDKAWVKSQGEAGSACTVCAPCWMSNGSSVRKFAAHPF